MKSRIFPTLSALFAVVIWGGTFIATKIALTEVSPATIVWIRFGIGVLILGATVLARKQFAIPEKSEWAYFALLGFLGVTFHQWLQANGLKTAQATTTAWIVATTPVFIAILGWLVLKEKMGWQRVGGIALAALGVLLIVSKGNLSALFAGKEGTFGDLLVLISAPNWAVFSILSRRELARHPAARMMFYVMLSGWLFTSIWIFGFGPGLTELPRLTASGWAAILMLGVFGSGLAYIAWYDALQALPASQLGAFLYIEPLVAMAMAAFMIGEAITVISLAGGAIIIFGVWLVNRQR
ncbi:MAG: DMT family transporter [Anaerolineaceae bacterium]|nr:MAG: DMT family transporter [Anaerolineaceae bacterium]